jgi:acyl-CoA synthetase (AMP-forming)/AMP-acid ligase II
MDTLSTNSIVDILNLRAKQVGDKIAFSLLIDSAIQSQITYVDLATHAQEIADYLRTMTSPGSRALLVFNDPLEATKAFLSCMYSGIIAVPTFAPNSKKRVERIRGIIANCQPLVALTSRDVFDNLEFNFGKEAWFTSVKWIYGNNAAAYKVDHSCAQQINKTDIAFLQYTSGSTGEPKGVMVNHSNLLANLKMLTKFFQNDEETVHVSWLPYYHDMGLIGVILQNIYAGGRCFLIRPKSFSQAPLDWLRAVSKFKATISGAPNCAYEICSRIKTEGLCEDLDLQSWKVAFCGAEPIRAHTMKAFAEKFGKYGFDIRSFRAGYGLAEATLMVTGRKGGEDLKLQYIDRILLQKKNIAVEVAPTGPNATIVSCGKTWEDAVVVVVDPQTKNPLSENEIGEIWVSGSSVSWGYWMQEDLSNKVFRNELEMYPGRRFLRTGDLGYLSQGELYITGRIKDIINLNGRNVYAHDIEYSIQKQFPFVLPNGCGAVAVQNELTEKVMLVIEINRGMFQRKAELLYHSHSVSRHLIDMYGLKTHAVLFTNYGAIPKTTSGKIERFLLKQHIIENQLKIAMYWIDSNEQDLFENKNFRDISAKVLNQVQLI